MIAGKTHSEILSMNRYKRCRWYKTILPEEKEEAMSIVWDARSVKISKALKGKYMGKNNHCFGKLRSEEIRTKISAGWTPEMRERQRNRRIGTILSEATKSKISVANTGKIRSDEANAKNRIAHTGKTHTEESKAKMGRSGNDNGNWQGGKSFEQYPAEFNEELRMQIRNRDNYTCRECQHTEEQLGRVLDVHHVDYNKTNNSPENLISLCRSCHAQTNFGREDWTEYFGGLA